MYKSGQLLGLKEKDKFIEESKAEAVMNAEGNDK